MKKSSKLILTAILLVTVLSAAILLSVGGHIFFTRHGTDDSVPADGSDVDTNTKKETYLNQKTEIKKFPISVSVNREDELVFDFSLDDYIKSFNGYYYRNNERRFILPVSFDNWQTQTLDAAIHSPHETVLYNYSADRSAWSLPTISVYVPTNSDCVQEITVDFDGHSYSDDLYELYNEMCYCTLRVFFPDLTDEQIIKLYSEANKAGSDNIFLSDGWYGNGFVPGTLFYKDGVGVYSHSAIGSEQRLCIIPVTEKTVNEFKEKGTEVICVR